MTDEKKDIHLVCSDCGNNFYFSVKDQIFYAERGFQQPRRCYNCRQTRKNNGSQAAGQPAPAQQPPRGKRDGNRRDDTDEYND